MTAAVAVALVAKGLAEAGLEQPRREARQLLSALGGPDGILRADEVLEEGLLQRYLTAGRRRARREPFAYVVGYREFWGLDIAVGPGVLIPRPETEGLVERALALAPDGARVVDLCTGSGAVALAVASSRADLGVDATDISTRALDVAARNVATLGLASRVRLHAGDLWGALPARTHGHYLVCTCNPPYVEARELGTLEPEVRDWEPRLALVPPGGWLRLYTRLARGAMSWLAPGGWLVAEVGARQGDAVAGILCGAGLCDVRQERDLSGQPRYVRGRRPT